MNLRQKYCCLTNFLLLQTDSFLVVIVCEFFVAILGVNYHGAIFAVNIGKVQSQRDIPLILTG